MILKTLIPITLLFILTTDTNAQNDKQLIESTIQNYFDGWLTGDTSLIGSAMHSSCHLKFISAGEVSIRNRTSYLSGFKPRPRLPHSKGKIINIT